MRRKTAFLLNTLLLSPTAAAAVAPTGAADAHVHPNSHAALVADPSSADTASATLRALHPPHALLPVIVRELTAPTPHGPDGEEGGASDADFEEKLARWV